MKLPELIKALSVSEQFWGTLLRYFDASFCAGRGVTPARAMPGSWLETQPIVLSDGTSHRPALVGFRYLALNLLGGAPFWLWLCLIRFTWSRGRPQPQVLKVKLLGGSPVCSHMACGSCGAKVAEVSSCNVAHKTKYLLSGPFLKNCINSFIPPIYYSIVL